MTTALVVDLWLPTPDRDTASLRMLYMLRLLREQIDSVIFAAADSSTYVRPSAHLLRAHGIDLLPDVWDGTLEEYLAARGRSLDLVVLSRLETATATRNLVETHAPQARTVYDTVDLHFVRRFRAAKLTGNLPMLKAAVETKQAELAIIRWADCVLVVSRDEMDVLGTECPEAKTMMLSIIHEVHPPTREFDEREGIVFIGAFPFHPNVDAMEYYDDQIRPLLASKLAGVTTTVIGSSPPESLLSRADHEFVITGFVPEVGSHFERARLSIAPLRYGAGVKGKVILSMSYGVPVVGTTVAAEGIPMLNGGGMSVADDPESFAAAIVELYHDRSLWNRRSANSVQTVEEHFSIAAARNCIAQMLAFLDGEVAESAA